jgi:hypothetical protein
LFDRERGGVLGGLTLNSQGRKQGEEKAEEGREARHSEGGR